MLAGIATVGIGGTYLISAVFSTCSLVFLLRLPRRSPAKAAAPAGPATAGAELRPGRARGASPLAEIRSGLAYVRGAAAAAAPRRQLVLRHHVRLQLRCLPSGAGEGRLRSRRRLGRTHQLGHAPSVRWRVSLPLAARADSPRAKTAMILGGIGFGLGVAAVGVAPTFWVAFVVICFVGAATTIFQSLSSTLAMAMTDDAHQGRVQSLMQLSFAGFGMAALPLGALAEVIGLRPTIVLMGAVALFAIGLYTTAERRSGAAASVELPADTADARARPVADVPASVGPITDGPASVGPTSGGATAAGSVARDGRLARTPAPGR